ncbi:hypothetical protein HanRHA438_Chr09g0382681 [Helianthus annuus]|nr:hypothetical protein HanIR_Chr09g0400291 [Helianthus annuus]KAJ0886717.1 hypothetical protein HanRHA438_Chr09g0382681 [Helianthus annuus]
MDQKEIVGRCGSIRIGGSTCRELRWEKLVPRWYHDNLWWRSERCKLKKGQYCNFGARVIS